MGYWWRGSTKRVSFVARSGHARRAFAIFQWGGADQRQLQLESRGAAGDDRIAGGHAEFPPAHSCCRGNARTRDSFGGIASRSRAICREDRQDRLGHRGSRERDADRGGRRGWRAPERARQVFCNAAGGRRIPGEVYRVRRSFAGKGFAGGENGGGRGNADRAPRPAWGIHGAGGAALILSTYFSST